MDEKKKLTRKYNKRMICGVCAGIAEYLNIDVTVVRLLFIIFGFTTAGIIVYIAAAFIMPEEY